MLRSEFENLTGLTVTEDKYSKIESSYMNSNLNKQQWCKQYVNRLRHKETANATYKNELKNSLKYLIENWIDDLKHNSDYMVTDETYIIKYADGSIIRFNYEYEGKKPSLQSIVNIYLLCSSCSMDYYNDFIGIKEDYDFLTRELDEKYDHPLIVNDMDDYYREYEVKNELKGVA